MLHIRLYFDHFLRGVQNGANRRLKNHDRTSPCKKLNLSPGDLI